MEFSVFQALFFLIIFILFGWQFYQAWFQPEKYLAKLNAPPSWPNACFPHEREESHEPKYAKGVLYMGRFTSLFGLLMLAFVTYLALFS